MNTIPRHLLCMALAAALSSAAGLSLAQDTDTDTDTTLVAEATVPADRLAERYATLAGSEEAAADLVSQLRTGEDFTVTEEVTTTTTNADGTTTTTTELVERTITNANGPMGYGEVNITLSLAQALLEGGAYADLQSALTGVQSTVTNADGTTSVIAEGGVLAMRADGMGWGQISKELGFNLGELVSASNRGTRTETARASASADRAEKGRTAQVERPRRPERPQKPVRPQRPERPERPDRGGGRG